MPAGRFVCHAHATGNNLRRECAIIDTHSSVLKFLFVFQVDFVNSFIAFSSTFVNAAPSTSEMALLCSMILLTPSRSGITDKCLVQTLRDKLVEALKFQVSPLNLFF